MANKSMYTDRANKATSRAKGDFIFTQKGDGTEASKGAEVEVVLASDLDNMETSNVMAFNSLAGSIPIANSTNTKAYAGDLSKIINSNYGIGIDMSSTSTGSIVYNEDFIIDNKSVCFILAGKLSFLTTEYSGYFLAGARSTDSLHAFGLYASGEKNKVTVRAYDGNSDHSTTSPLFTIDPDMFSVLACVLNREDNTIDVYLNNILVSKTTLIAGFGKITISANPLVFAGYPYISGIIVRFGWFNYNTSDDLTMLFNSGRYDNTILPDYMKWGNNTDLVTGWDFETGWTPYDGASITSSSKITTTAAGGIYSTTYYLSVNKLYNVKLYIKNNIPVVFRDSNSGIGSVTIPTNGDFTEYNFTYKGLVLGSSGNICFDVAGAGIIEVQTMEITQAGAIADLAPQGIVVNSSSEITSWTDSSTNDNDATVSGTPDLVIVKAEEFEGQGMHSNEFIFKTLDASAGVNVGDALFLPPQWSIVRCIAYNYGTSSVNIKLGSTNGGGEYVSTKNISAGELVNFNVPDAKDPYSITDFLPMYLNSASWGTAKVKARFVLMHVPWGE